MSVARSHLHAVSSSARRRVSVAEGRALEILGHAVEYLSDEYALSVEEAGRLDSDDPRVEAIQLLMSANRQVYYSCPTLEPLLRRLGRLVGYAGRVPAKAGRAVS